MQAQDPRLAAPQKPTPAAGAGVALPRLGQAWLRAVLSIRAAQSAQQVAAAAVASAAEGGPLVLSAALERLETLHREQLRQQRGWRADSQRPSSDDTAAFAAVLDLVLQQLPHASPSLLASLAGTAAALGQAVPPAAQASITAALLAQLAGPTSRAVSGAALVSFAAATLDVWALATEDQATLLQGIAIRWVMFGPQDLECVLLAPQRPLGHAAH